MGDLGATLIKELNCETAFTIGGIGISESVVVTWIMMAVVLVVSLIVTHGLKVEHPGRGQLLLENAVTWLQGIGEGILGEEGKGYAAVSDIRADVPGRGEPAWYTGVQAANQGFERHGSTGADEYCAD